MLRTRGVASLVAALVVAAGCSADARNQAAADESVAPALAELRVAITEPIAPDPALLNPTRAIDVVAADLLFDGLTSYDAATREVQPAVASSWTTSDGTSWQFTIADGRTFSNGAPVTAADVVASLNRAASLHASSIAGGRLDIIAGFADLVAGASDGLSGLAAVDLRTVAVQLSSVNYELPALLADPSYGIVAQAGSGAPAVASQTAFSGPFRVRSGGADGATLVATGQIDTAVDAVEFVRVADADAARAALEAGTVDLAPLPDGDAPDGATVVETSAATMVVEVSSTIDPWDDGAARSALLSVIDRRSVAAAATGDATDVAASFVPGGVVTAACADGCATVGDAAAAIAATGAAPTTAHLDVPAGAKSAAAGADLARQLVAAGLPTEVRPSDADGLRAAVAAGSLEMAVFAVIGLAPTPDPYLAATLSSAGGENLSGLASAEFDAALAVARSTVEAGPRRDAYGHVERLAMQAATVIPLAAIGERFAVSKRVDGVVPAVGVLFDGTVVSLR